MEVAEIESDGIRVRPEPLHTGTFLEQAVEQCHDQLANHRITIIVQQPDTPVWFDPHVIGRVLRHLLENAARYTPINSRVLLRSRRVLGKVEFSVEDDGPGIPEAERGRVRQRFYRLPGSQGHGCGLGLAIVEEIARLHRAAVTIDAGAGDHGTRIRVQFSASPAARQGKTANAVTP